MGNMSYCKFENTYYDLKKCWDEFDDCESESETKYRKLLVKLCQEIAEDAMV